MFEFIVSTVRAMVAKTSKTFLSYRWKIFTTAARVCTVAIAGPSPSSLIEAKALVHIAVHCATSVTYTANKKLDYVR